MFRALLCLLSAGLALPVSATLLYPHSSGAIMHIDDCASSSNGCVTLISGARIDGKTYDLTFEYGVLGNYINDVVSGFNIQSLWLNYAMEEAVIWIDESTPRLFLPAFGLHGSLSAHYSIDYEHGVYTSVEIESRLGAAPVSFVALTDAGIFADLAQTGTWIVKRPVAVPEPAALALLGAGLVPLLLRRKIKSSVSR